MVFVSVYKCIILIALALFFLPIAHAADGSLSICVNTAPSLSFPCLSNNLSQNVFYGCQLIANDSSSASFIYDFITTSGGLNGTINSSGYFSTTPTQSMVGASTVNFTVDDNSGCSNSVSSTEVFFNVTNQNDAPVYSAVIPTITFSEGQTYRGLFLDDYFTDPDGDALTYTVLGKSSHLSISILGTSEIVLSENECRIGSIVFRASDPFNLTADSGVVTVQINCIDESVSGSSSGGGGGGGGGGGSSGATITSCDPDWSCGDWGRCYINETQKKRCTDLNGCDPDYYIQYFWQECTYYPHCNNGVQDIDEEGVDCGGDDCAICQTCSDNILNNDEEEIDCGGPNCPACSNCNDGIQNYQETGVDCGGPSCGPCQHCFDGILNGDETGVDCGGSCGLCAEQETPGLFGNDDEGVLSGSLITVIGISAAGALTYVLLRKQINTIVTMLIWALLRRKRKEVILNKKQKEHLLSQTRSLESKGILDLDEDHHRELAQDDVADIAKKLFSFLVNTNLDDETVYEEIDKLDISKPAKALLKKQYAYHIFYQKKYPIYRIDNKIYMELLRNMIFSITEVNRKDVSRPVHEMTIDKSKPVFATKQLVYNGLLALQFGELGIAKKKYAEAIGYYNTLDQEGQAEVFSVLNLFYDHILFVARYEK